MHAPPGNIYVFRIYEVVYMYKASFCCLETFKRAYKGGERMTPPASPPNETMYMYMYMYMYSLSLKHFARYMYMYMYKLAFVNKYCNVVS